MSTALPYDLLVCAIYPLPPWPLLVWIKFHLFTMLRNTMMSAHLWVRFLVFFSLRAIQVWYPASIGINGWKRIRILNEIALTSRILCVKSWDTMLHKIQWGCSVPQYLRLLKVYNPLTDGFLYELWFRFVPHDILLQDPLSLPPEENQEEWQCAIPFEPSIAHVSPLNLYFHNMCGAIFK